MVDDVLLVARNVFKQFGGVQAIDDVSITVRSGSIHAVIGPNGAGKTTFFNALSGFAAPDAGSVTFRGADITKMSNWQRVVAGMGRTLQTPSIFPELTVYDNIMLGVRSRAKAAFQLRAPSGEDKRIQEARVDELLGFVNLGKVRNRLVSELS